MINPIIAAIFGKGSFTEIGFDIGDARISIGLVLDALISFVVVGDLPLPRDQGVQQVPRATAPAEPSPEVTLLTEIRDELRTGRTQP